MSCGWDRRVPARLTGTVRYGQNLGTSVLLLLPPSELFCNLNIIWVSKYPSNLWYPEIWKNVCGLWDLNLWNPGLAGTVSLLCSWSQYHVYPLLMSIYSSLQCSFCGIYLLCLLRFLPLPFLSCLPPLPLLLSSFPSLLFSWLGHSLKPWC